METRSRPISDARGRALFSVFLLVVTTIALFGDSLWCWAVFVVAIGVGMEYFTLGFRAEPSAEYYSLRRFARLFPPFVIVYALGAFSALALYEVTHTALVVTVYATYVNDVLAYVFGKLLGRQYISAQFWKYSPSKTWEGTLGGALGTLHLGILYAVWSWTHHDSHWWLWPMISLLAALGAILGDMLGSAIKRSMGVKDSAPGVLAKLWLGHGGCFDRFLALLTALTLVAFVVKFLG